jgi:hypothetical protein
MVETVGAEAMGLEGELATADMEGSGFQTGERLALKVP